MPPRIEAVAFDSFGTLFDLTPLGRALTDLGLPAGALETFLARLLRDAFAIDLAGGFVPFSEIAEGALQALCVANRLDVATGQVRSAVGVMAELPAFPEAPAALELATRAGAKTAIITNGGAAVAQGLLERNGLTIDRVVSADAIRHFKPHREPYTAAAGLLGVEPPSIGFVSAHAWDVHGARRAGLVAAWVSRLERRFQSALGQAEIAAADLEGAVRALVGE